MTSITMKQKKIMNAEFVGEAIFKKRVEVNTKRNAANLILKIMTIALAVYIMLTIIFGCGVVEGEGMYPRMRDGDLVIYYRLENSFDIGSIVAFEIDNQQYYGRIVAQGGDIVDINENGQLLVNGSVQQEEIFFETTNDGRQTEFPLTLEEGELFVLGDNRTEAVDSRDYGAIKEEDVAGKIITLLRRRGL